jgi:hypothetical protein
LAGKGKIFFSTLLTGFSENEEFPSLLTGGPR